MVIMVHIPLDLTASMIMDMVRCWFDMSRLFVGSSSISTDGSCTIALAICTFWNSPPLIPSRYFSDRWDIPRASMTSETLERSSSEANQSMYGFLPTSTASKTLILDTGVVCGTNPILLAISLPFGIIYGAAYATMSSLFSGSFEPTVRYSAVSFIYQFSGIFASGLTPMIATMLVSSNDGQPWYLCAYLLVAAVISSLSTIWITRLQGKEELPHEPETSAR